MCLKCRNNLSRTSQHLDNLDRNIAELWSCNGSNYAHIVSTWLHYTCAPRRKRPGGPPWWLLLRIQQVLQGGWFSTLSWPYLRSQHITPTMHGLGPFGETGLQDSKSSWLSRKAKFSVWLRETTKELAMEGLDCKDGEMPDDCSVIYSWHKSMLDQESWARAEPPLTLRAFILSLHR